MEEKSAYEQKAQAKLDKLNGEMQILKAKKDEASADAKLEYQKKIDELNALKQKSVKQLEEIKNSSSGAWEELKAGFEMSAKDMEEAISAAVAKFK